MAFGLSYPISRALSHAPANALLGGNSIGVRLSAASLPENSAEGTAVGTLSVSGGIGTYTFSLTDSAGSRFKVAGTNGVNLQAGATASNAEVAQSYSITVHADNGAGSAFDRTFPITISDVNEATPVITSNGGGSTAAVDVVEGELAVSTVTATDADVTSTISYSISGGADAALFAINSATGVLTFIDAPSFDTPTDADVDGTYIVIVQASDGTNTDTQTITVTVTEYIAGAVAFDGDVYLKNAAMVGTPSHTMLLSTWINSHWTEGDTTRTKACTFQADGLDDASISGSTYCWFPDTSPAGYFAGAASNDVRPGPTDVLWYQTPPAGLETEVWTHVLISVNTSTASPTIQAYCNDVDIAPLVNTTAGTAPFLQDIFARNFYIPDWSTVSALPPIQDMADFWLSTDDVDISIEANRRLFIKDSGKPVNPSVARRALGTPDILMSGDAASFAVNQGTAGAFTVLDGSLTDAATSPSDSGGLPATPIGEWYADEFVASPRRMIPNAVSAATASKNLLAYPKRIASTPGFWITNSATLTAGITDPSGGTDAVRVNGTGDFILNCGYNPVLEAGTYTMAITAKRHGASDQSFVMAFGTAGLESGVKVATSAYQRFYFTGTVGAGAQQLWLARSADHATGADLDIIDVALYAGTTTTEVEPALGGHLYLGKDHFDTSTSCASGVLDLSGNGLGTIQFPSGTQASAFTVLAVASKTVDVNGFNGLLNSFDAAASLDIQLDNARSDFVSFGGNQRTFRNVTAGSNYYGKGWKMLAFRNDGAVSSKFINGVRTAKIADIPPTLPASVTDMMFGCFYEPQYASNGYKFSAVALYDRALSDAEIATAYTVLKARAASSSLSIAETDRFLIAVGDSITAFEPTYIDKYCPNASPQVFAADWAQGGGTISNTNTFVADIDAMLASQVGTQKFILSVFFGANDLGSFSVSDYLTALASFCDARRAAGWTVALCTILPQSIAHSPGFNANRNTANATISTWVGTHCDALVDFAAVTGMGADADAEDAAKYPDGLHPSEAGQILLEPTYRAVIDAL